MTDLSRLLLASIEQHDAEHGDWTAKFLERDAQRAVEDERWIETERATMRWRRGTGHRGECRRRRGWHCVACDFDEILVGLGPTDWRDDRSRFRQRFIRRYRR